MSYEGFGMVDKVLIIEDDIVDRMVFEKFASKSNFIYPYILCASLKEAHTHLQSETFACIVSDYNLGDGIALNLFSKVKDTPIIIVTGLGDEKIAVQAMKLGAYDYLVKDAAGQFLEALPITIEKAIQTKNSEIELKLYRKNLEVLVKERTSELAAEIAQHKRTLSELQISQVHLKRSNSELQEKNMMLKGVLTQVENEKNSVHENIALNIERSIKPTIKKLKIFIQNKDYDEAINLMRLIEDSLNDINTDFFKNLENLNIALTQTEIRVCHLIKSGYPQKEIANILNISIDTVKGHNKNIRKKIGLTNNKLTLKSYFESVPNN